MPPPRVYITVSRSGQTRRPCRVMSSPVFTMAVISASGSTCRSPRRKRAPPIPPASATIRMRPVNQPHPSGVRVGGTLAGRRSAYAAPVSDEGAPPGASAIRRALRRARDGVTLDRTEAEVLLGVTGDELVDLMA